MERAGDEVNGRMFALALLTLVVLIVTALAAGQLAAAPPAPTGDLPSGGPRSPEAPSASVPPQLPAPAITVYEGPLAPPGLRPTAHKAQNKLFRHEGDWWGVLAEPVTTAFTIHRLDWDSQHWIDTGTFVDHRADADSDVLWDGEHLVVASSVDGGGADSAARVSRYHFVPEDSRFEIDADFPVELTDHGVEAIVVDRDSKDRLWVAYTDAGRVYVNHSDHPGDAIWHTPSSPPGPEARVADDDIAAIVPVGDGMGVVWSNQRLNAIYFAVVDADGADRTWSAVETAAQGMLIADDHLNVKSTAAGAIVVAVKTSLDELDQRNSQAPLTLLLERRPDESWHRHLFGRVEDRHTRPIVLVDDAEGLLYVLANAPSTGGTVYAKWSPQTQISFTTGPGHPVIEARGDIVYVDPTSAKQAVRTSEGFIVLAYDRGAGRYVHALIGGTDHPPNDRPAPPTPPRGGAVVINDEFDVWPVGDRVRNGWAMRRADIGRLEVVEPGRRGHGVLLAPGTLDRDVRACKSFGLTGSGTILASAWARVEAVGPRDHVIIAVRGDDDAATIRFGQGGEFAWYASTEKVRTDVPFQLGQWYRAQATIDLNDLTYDVEIRDASGRVLVSATGVPWRSRSAGELNAVCVQSSITDAGAIRFDDVRVELLP